MRHLIVATGARWVAPAIATGVLLVAGLSLFLPPPGLVTLVIAVLCLWRWDGAAGRRLDALGLGSRQRLRLGGAVLVAAAAANLLLGGQLDGHLMYRGDFQTYYVGAQVGLRHGWSMIFDQALQHPLWTAAFAGRAPFIPYLNTPPQAWLVAPLSLLPFPTAFATWVGLMVAVAAAVVWMLAPPGWAGRAFVGVAALSLWVLAYSLAGGQNAILEALAIVLCWRCLGAGREGWAGAALALILVRPNGTFLVPAAMLLSGHRSLFLSWLVVSAAAGAVVVFSLGLSGMHQFLVLGAEIRRTHPGALTMTVAHVLGDGLPGLLAGVALAGGGLWAAWRAGPGRPEAAIAAGVLASFFVTPYIHVQDVLALLAAATMVARSHPRASFAVVVAALLLAAPPGSLFGAAWAAVLVTVEVGWLAWLAWVTRRRSGPAMAPG